MVKEEQIGQCIKQLRIDRGLTISALAEKTGFSKGYLSKVENSKKSPPVSTLITLAKAMGVSVSAIFSEEEPESTITLIKRQDRQAMAREGSTFGYSFEPLAYQFPKRHMDPYVVVVPVDVNGTKLFQHKGEEMIFMLEGSMKFNHGDKIFQLEEGDCLYFDASIPHRAYSVGCEKAKCLMVIYSGEDN